HGCRPVDGPIAWPQMLVFQAVVVVHVDFADSLAQRTDSLGDSGCYVRVTQVKADVDLVEVGHFENCHQVLWSCSIAGQVFNQYAYPQRLGKSAEMLKSSS